MNHSFLHHGRLEMQHLLIVPYELNRKTKRDTGIYFAPISEIVSASVQKL
jgi:hypothetical protein